MRSLVLSVLFFCTVFTFAQDTNYVDPNYNSQKERSEPIKRSSFKRVYFGGTFGLSFGTYTSILLEPMVGFRMTEKLSTGVGFGIRYGKDNSAAYNLEYTNYIGRVFARYLVIPRFYLHSEYMVESYDKVFLFEGQSLDHNSRTMVPFLFVGGGLRSQAGNGSFIIQVLFNVLQNHQYSRQVYPSGSPYISIGYIGGF